MSLSSGTLNLKFMQRAAAKAAAASPKPAASPAGTPAPATPTPAPASTSASTPTPQADESKWTLPRRSHAPSGPSRRVQVSFVSSYLPFMDDAPAMSTGGGRRAFGGFGDKPEPEEGEEEDIEAVVGSDGEADAVVRTRKGGKEKSTEERQSRPEAQRTFQRPAGFELSNAQKKQSNAPKQSSAPKQSNADKLRATISGMKSVSVSPSPSGASPSGASTPKSSGKKRSHPSTPADKSKRPKTEKMSLDDREKALKAEKKAQKKKNKAK